MTEEHLPGIIGATNGTIMMKLPEYLDNKEVSKIEIIRNQNDSRWHVKVYAK